MTLFLVIATVLTLGAIGVIALPLLRKGGETVSRIARLASIAALGLGPILAAIAYVQVGAPHALDPEMRNASTAPEDPAAALAAMAPEERSEAINNMVESLSARLSVDPNDLSGWRMLARSYGVLGRYDEAADAWREALVQSEGAADDWRGLAMALVEGRDPASAPAIKEAFEEVLLQEPDDSLALYFLGHASNSSGNSARAEELWVRLRAQTPDDAPLAAELDKLLASLQNKESLDNQ